MIVTFDGDAATDVVVVNSTTITCVTPAHAAGLVSFTGTNADSQAGTLPNGYTYLLDPFPVPLTPEGVTPVVIPLPYVYTLPSYGTTLGGTPVKTFLINDTFNSNPTVLFLDPNAIPPDHGAFATAVLVTSPTELACLTPPHAEGVCDVIVSTTKGDQTLKDGFLYYPPLSTAVPTYGSALGGTVILIKNLDTNGTPLASFDTLPNVVFRCIYLGVAYDKAASYVTVSSDKTVVTCTTPYHPGFDKNPSSSVPVPTWGLVDIIVSTIAYEGVIADGFLYTRPRPTVALVDPLEGTTAGGTTLTIYGHEFGSRPIRSSPYPAPSNAVYIGGIPSRLKNPDTDEDEGVTIKSPNKLTCVTPAHFKGEKTILIRNS
jgi:hypothetical protein